MIVRMGCRLFVFVVLLCAVLTATFAQETVQPAESGTNRIYLDVVVTSKSGQPVSGLQQADFTLLDNNAPQTIASFQAFNGRQSTAKVVLVIDAVNVSDQKIALERQEIGKFLLAEGGHLAHPTTIAVLTDAGMQIQPGFSEDGEALNQSLGQHVIQLRAISRTAGFYGAVDRFQISLNGLQEIAQHEALEPGRCIIVWISPGWPFLSGPEVILSKKQQLQIFSTIVGISNDLQQSHASVYSVDPLGISDFGARTDYWKSFLGGVREPDRAQPGNLALQVLAVHSGGLALNTSNDIAGLLRKCVADADSYYELSFDPGSSARPNEYRRLEVKVAQKGLTVRTQQQYYSQPASAQ